MKQQILIELSDDGKSVSILQSKSCNVHIGWDIYEYFRDNRQLSIITRNTFDDSVKEIKFVDKP